jgi:hypothetical protein
MEQPILIEKENVYAGCDAEKHQYPVIPAHTRLLLVCGMGKVGEHEKEPHEYALVLVGRYVQAKIVRPVRYVQSRPR